MSVTRVQQRERSSALAPPQAFFDRYYGPANLTIAIVGDADPRVVQRLAERYWGDWEGPAGYTVLPRTGAGGGVSGAGAGGGAGGGGGLQRAAALVRADEDPRPEVRRGWGAGAGSGAGVCVSVLLPTHGLLSA